MAYPVVSAPYGLRPVNAIGNSNFTGITREYPIQYGYATSIFYGDIVGLTRGRIARLSVTGGSSLDGTVTGVFMGCYYTDPTTKQQHFSQYWPASTLAQGVAIVADDPDTVFKVAVCSTGVVMASGAEAMIGQNLAMLNNTGSTATGNSANAAAAPTDTPVNTILPLRCLGLVKDTAVQLGTCGYTSISTATVTCAALPSALTVGTDVYSLAANGQIIASGSFVDTAASAGATSFIMNQAPATAFVASSTLGFIQYPEILVKFDATVHQYGFVTSIA